MQLFDNAQMDGTMGHSREPIILTNRYMTEGITSNWFYINIRHRRKIFFCLPLLPILKAIEKPMDLLIKNRFEIHSSILILKLLDSYDVIRGKM